MSVSSLTMLIIAGVLVGAGVYLLLERSLSRIFIGLGLLTHGINVLILASGGASGRPPLLGLADASEMADPLPQAMMLTAIVLSLGTTAFGLALSYRSWRLSGHDEVIDDIEDRWLAGQAEKESNGADVSAATGEEDAGIDYDADEDSDFGYGSDSDYNSDFGANKDPDPWGDNVEGNGRRLAVDAAETADVTGQGQALGGALQGNSRMEKMPPQSAGDRS